MYIQYMTVLDDIRRHWHLKHSRNGLFPKLEWRQRGGAVVYIDKHPIHVREVKDGKHVYIYGGPARPCFSIELQKNHAILQDIARGTHCFMDGHTASRDIVRAAAMVAKEHGARTMELSDNSVIYCPERIALSDLSFVTTGQTWYESVLPNMTATKFTFLDQWRNAVKTNTWRKVGQGLPMFDTKGIDIDAPGSAMVVLNRAKNSRRNCALLSSNMDQILQQSGILSMYGRHWVCRF
jgi:hypothetical protein